MEFVIQCTRQRRIEYIARFYYTSFPSHASNGAHRRAISQVLALNIEMKAPSAVKDRWYASIVILLGVLALAGCGSANDSNRVAETAPTTNEPPLSGPTDTSPDPRAVPSADSPSNPPVTLPEDPSAPPPAEAPEPLSGWFSGGFADKTVVVWGNSTVSNAIYYFDQLRLHSGPGGALEGLDPDNVLNYGNNGASLRALLSGLGPYPINTVIAAHPDLLIIRAPLINDVRLGLTTFDQAREMLVNALEWVRAESPQTEILLTTENSLLTTDAYGYGWVQPNSAAQRYTEIMHDAVMAMDGRYPNVEVFDVMALEYGINCAATSLLMADQLHPNELGQRQEADLIVSIIGRKP